MTRGGRVLIQDCCLTARGQWLGPAQASPRGGSGQGLTGQGSGPEHNTMARGNYASCGLGNGGGRDIWTLTSNPGSLVSHNTAATLEGAAG